MKKTFYILAAIAVALTACTKETPSEIGTPSNQETVVASESYELFAKVDDITKASIAEANGAFTWNVGESGDEIAVKTSSNNVYKFKAVEIISDCARFTCDETIDGTPVSAVYPYTDDASCTLPTEISSLNGALSSGSIRLNGTISDGKNITFQHANALLKVSFTNVPTFASKIVFDGDQNDVTVSGISLSARGDVAAYIPVDPTTSSFTVSIVDDNDNPLLTKSTSSKSFSAGALLRMASLSVEGTVFVFNDPFDAIDEARFFKSDGNNTTWETNSYLPLNSFAEGKKWCIVNNSSLGSIVEMQTFKNGTYKSTTQSLFLYRDFEITIPENGNGIKTNYRTYFYLNSTNSQTYWGSTTNIVVNGTTKSMTKFGDYLFYYENAIDDYGQTMSYKFNNGNNWNANSDAWEYVLDREYQYNFNG